MSPHDWPALTQPPAPPDDEEGAGHDLRRRDLGLTDQPTKHAAAVHALAVALLRDMSPEQLFDAFREAFVAHDGHPYGQPLIASTGACVPPCAAPVEAQAAGPER